MSKRSQVTLLIGLAVGSLAIWSGAAPIGLTGDLVTQQSGVSPYFKL